MSQFQPHASNQELGHIYLTRHLETYIYPKTWKYLPTHKLGSCCLARDLETYI